MSTPSLTLRAGARVLRLGERPWLMGVLNATPDSFSDGGRHPTLAARLAHGRDLAAAGADLIDVGGESAVTNRPAVGVDEELERVVPLIERLATEVPVAISVETHKPAVAAAALAAGACMVNDVSGLRDPALAEVCARAGAALVVMHTRAAPKERLTDPRYEDVTADVVGFLRERIALALARGVAAEQIVVDPGPDFAKTPAQSVAVLRRLDELQALGRPLLLAVSRKDFVGALTGRPPGERLAGTLAAVGWGLDRGAHILRVHDVAATADFLAVRRALRGEEQVSDGLRLPDALRWAPTPSGRS